MAAAASRCGSFLLHLYTLQNRWQQWTYRSNIWKHQPGSWSSGTNVSFKWTLTQSISQNQLQSGLKRVKSQYWSSHHNALRRPIENLWVWARKPTNLIQFHQDSSKIVESLQKKTWNVLPQWNSLVTILQNTVCILLTFFKQLSLSLFRYFTNTKNMFIVTDLNKKRLHWFNLWQ